MTTQSKASEIVAALPMRDEFEGLLRRLVNLSNHPLFHPQTELPAWDKLIRDARAALR